MKLGHGHGAHNLLFASYQPKHQRLDVFLFDVQTGKRTSSQEDLALTARTERLTELSAALLQLGKEPPPPSPLGPGLVPASAPSRPPLGLPKWRTGLGISLGLLTIGALTTAIWATAANGDTRPATENGVNVRQQFQTKSIMAAGYSLAGGLALGAGLTFLWPSSHAATTSKETRP